MMLFLYSGEFLRGYFQEEAWLACLTGDFLTQFFYYIGGGPFILSVVFNFICPCLPIGHSGNSSARDTPFLL